MYKHDLIERMLALPKEIEKAENNILSLSIMLDAAKDEIDDIEREAILNGTITGKNETERRAQMTALTLEARRKMNDIEAQLGTAKIAYNSLMNEFKSLQAIAQLLSNQIQKRRI